MTKERKRGLSLILAMLLLFVAFSGSLGTAAYAEEAKAEETPVVEEAPKAEEAAPAEDPEVVVYVAMLGGDKAEEAKEETPAEEVKEEKNEEAKQEDGNKKLTIAEQLDPKRKITVKAEWDGEELYFGDTATLKATLSGYDNAVYTIRWQTSKDGNKWEDIKGADDGPELPALLRVPVPRQVLTPL